MLSTHTPGQSQQLLPLRHVNTLPPKEYNLQKGGRNGWLFDSRRPRESKSPLRGLTFSESDIGRGYSYSFRSPSGRQQGSVRGKDDVAIACAFSCSSVYLQRGSDSWGGSSVCFPGVSSPLQVQATCCSSNPSASLVTDR